MQICSCKVRLGGSLNMQIYKPRVSVAEIAVLQAIHGGDAVQSIKPVRMTKESHAVEAERLRLFFGPEVIARLWPGLNPRLPVKLSDIGIGEDGIGEDVEAQVNDPEDAGDTVSRHLAEAAGLPWPPVKPKEAPVTPNKKAA